jgi:hypothetical protein
MSEAKAIAQAFEHAGRTVAASFVENYSRASATEMSRFANPIDVNLEEVLSEQNVVRVGGVSRLAWHVYAEVGPDEWYEILLDAFTGELLLRHNLYLKHRVRFTPKLRTKAHANSFHSLATQSSTRPPAGWELRP